LTVFRLFPKVVLQTGTHNHVCTSKNWKHGGAIKGRGKMDRFNESAPPVKDFYLYPPYPAFIRLLC